VAHRAEGSSFGLEHVGLGRTDIVFWFRLRCGPIRDRDHVSRSTGLRLALVRKKSRRLDLRAGQLDEGLKPGFHSWAKRFYRLLTPAIKSRHYSPRTNQQRKDRQGQARRATSSQLLLRRCGVWVCHAFQPSGRAVGGWSVRVGRSSAASSRTSTVRDPFRYRKGSWVDREILPNFRNEALNPPLAAKGQGPAGGVATVVARSSQWPPLRRRQACVAG